MFPKALDILLEGVPVVSSRGYLGYCTVVLFRVGGRWGLFDTGHYNDRHLLLEALSARGLKPGDIHLVVLSHLHFDHVLNLPLFRNAEVFVAGAEIRHAEQVSSGDTIDHALVDFWRGLLEGRKLALVEESAAIGDGWRLSVKPGHTPGCMALLYDGPDCKAVVCGDALKNAWEAVTGKATMALAGNDKAAESIKSLVEAGGVIVPGHDRPFLMEAGVPRFLRPCRWDLRASWYPEPQDSVFLTLSSGAGVMDMPSA